jgi:aspartate-semialdehyde dehydrogenase
MTALRDSNRIVIAGASSLLGAELKSLLEESRFAGADFTLLDEELAAGTLTGAKGEPAVIQPVEEGSFNRARFIFFTGSANFTRANLTPARASNATIVDLSGALAGEPAAPAWFPAMDTFADKPLPKNAASYSIPSAAATAAASLALGLGPTGQTQLQFTAFQPVSEAGRGGIEELESQTTQLLSFQNVGKPVFDAQVAFSLLDRFGSESLQKLDAVRERVQAEIRALLAGTKFACPAVEILHAPVFYGLVFSASSVIPIPDVTEDQLAELCSRLGFLVLADDGPSNQGVAGEDHIQLAKPRSDAGQAGTWWFFGGADNIRLPAAHAVKLADKLSA